MLTNNFKVRPDPHGDIVQQYAAAIVSIDPNAVCPHDPREARKMLAELQQKRGTPRDSGQDLRLSQIHEVYNGLLPQLAKAKRMGIRSPDAKPPALPQGGSVSPDDLAQMTAFSHDLDSDIASYESQTPDQRRIADLERRIAGIMKALKILVRQCDEYKNRIEALEAISLPVAA